MYIYIFVKQSTKLKAKNTLSFVDCSILLV